ncbi:hypothetical protein B8A42_09300 [Dolosigranulum pigrum]|uniref:type A2 lanthipeptide n=1 Tax=Dolosigranulum pigrum TaxID=29394 RepID=UPI000DC03A71|nr:type A2 lanthipeptide [Dolosigranulum pigrum]RAN53932.1 hypothetical protein B8A42_09300 [Dolosigranulum pigrum]
MQEKRQQLVQVVSDTELEVLIGGKGPGLVKTLTKDYPEVLSEVCGGIAASVEYVVGAQIDASGCKNCEN